MNELERTILLNSTTVNNIWNSNQLVVWLAVVSGFQTIGSYQSIAELLGRVTFVAPWSRILCAAAFISDCDNCGARIYTDTQQKHPFDQLEAFHSGKNK